MKLRILPLVALLSACVDPRAVSASLVDTEVVIRQAEAVHARLCAPEALADAHANVAFTRLEGRQADVRRAKEHADLAAIAAKDALAKATPCGTADADQDKIADVVDRCDDEPEDYDGIQDEDGCRDIDPYGDEDKDGIKNIDDGCIDDPEDVDGDADDDGCPETSLDVDGDGLIDAVDKCPKDAEDLDGYQDRDGCPEPDNDGDTVADIHDNCISIPEDLDGWDDLDGCPEPDNDFDGIPDAADRCPNQPGDRLRDGCPSQDADSDGIGDANDRCPSVPETVNQYLDDDGCPDVAPATVKVTRDRIVISDMIQFETSKATILAPSRPTLDEVAKVMMDRPDLKIRVEGHTDDQGSDVFNLELSQKRAESVAAYLASKGIEPSRLEAVGFGEQRPIDTNRTTAGRATNRRVEFHIVD